MKTTIICEERFPFYILSDSGRYGWVVNVPRKTLDRWQAVFADFEKVQEEMGVLCKEKGEMKW